MERKLTEKEWDLIETIRNYHKSFPNGKQELEWFIEILLNELLDRE